MTPSDAPTIGQFRDLALDRGWPEEWLVEQCRHEMDAPTATVREILSGYGNTRSSGPWSNGKSERVSLKNTVLVWAPLLKLYATYAALCLECNTTMEDQTAKYCSPECRGHAARKRQRRMSLERSRLPQDQRSATAKGA